MMTLYSDYFKKLFGWKNTGFRERVLTEEEVAEETKRILSHPNCIRVPYTIDQVMSLPPKVRDVVWPDWRKYLENNTSRK